MKEERSKYKRNRSVKKIEKSSSGCIPKTEVGKERCGIDAHVGLWMSVIYSDEERATECVLWMEKCSNDRLVANRMMLCIRNMFIVENMRDITPEEYTNIIIRAGYSTVIRY